MRRFALSALLVCAVALLPAGKLHAQVLSSRLLGWWKMDETPGATTLKDSSGYGRNATLGAGVSIVDGKFGKAARFDGTTAAGANFSFNKILTNFTYSVWVNVPNTYTNNSFPKIIQLGNMYYQFSYQTPEQFNIGIGTVPTRAEWTSAGASPFKLVTNQWLHAALVVKRLYTNATDWVVQPTFFINGVRCGVPGTPMSYSPDAVGAGGFGFLGNSGIGGARALDGTLDDVRIYDQALSDKEILALYQNCPVSADAGAGQTCYRASTALQGRLFSTNPYSHGIAATSVWSVVSAPSGVPPSFENTSLPSTSVTLPESGTYVFRLTAVSELGIASNDVTIVRVSGEATGNAAPAVTTPWATTNIVLSQGVALTGTVSDDSKPTNSTRVCWSKVSGPGGVFFDNPFTNSTTAYFSTNGSYVLQLEADDGAATKATNVTVTVSLPTGNLSNGLIHWWRMDEDPAATKSYDSAGTNTLTFLNQTFLQPGKTGYGIRFPTYGAAAQAASVFTNADSLSFSLWLYFDAAYTNNVGKRIFNIGSSRFFLYYNPNVLFLATSGANGPDCSWLQKGPTLTSNQWVHVAVLFDRRPYSSYKPGFYINGSPCDTDPKVNYPGATNIIGTLYIGGNTTGRNFDGVFDDMRVYNRLLTVEEVKTLAVDPDNNHAPVIEAQAAASIKVRQALSSLATVYDDGQPLGQSLATRWSVTSGDASQVQFANADAPGSAVTFTRSGSYVLTLTASDGELRSAASTRVTVTPTGTVLLVQ
jgi:hypothetical protein